MCWLSLWRRWEWVHSAYYCLILYRNHFQSITLNLSFPLFCSTMLVHFMVVKVRNRESSPCPTWRPELRTSWWPQMWQAEVSTSTTSPWSSTTTWPRTLRVSPASFLSLHPLNIFPLRTLEWLYQWTSWFSFPFWGLIFNFAFLRLYPSYWPNGSCWKEWYGNDIPDQRRLFCVLRLETGHLRKPCVHLPARAGQSPRSPAQAWHHPYQEEERGDHLCLIQTPHTCCCFSFVHLVTVPFLLSRFFIRDAQ